MELKIPYYTLDKQHRAIRHEMEQATSALLDGGQFILSAQTLQFEEELAAWLGAQRVVGMGNGSDALYASLIVAGIGPGDEVIVPAHTCVATWIAVSRTGASVVPVDVSKDTWLIEAGAIESAITAKTKAVVPVHLYGLPCNMPAIAELSDSRKILVIEDNAQGMGASIAQRKTGTWGWCNALSFYPTKNLGALGDGGAVVTDDERAWQQVTSFRNYGIVRKNDKEVPGINSRLDEFQSSILRIKLRQLARWNQQRRDLAKAYDRQLANLKEVIRPVIVAGGEAVYHIYAISVPNRDRLREYLKSKGIGTAVHYPVAALRQDAYRNSNIKGSFSVADWLAQTQVSLPVWPGMTEEHVTEVCDRIGKFLSS